MNWFDFDKDKENKEKDNKKDDTLAVPKTITIYGPKIGDVKVIKIHPGGYVQIKNGGL